MCTAIMLALRFFKQSLKNMVYMDDKKFNLVFRLHKTKAIFFTKKQRFQQHEVVLLCEMVWLKQPAQVIFTTFQEKEGEESFLLANHVSKLHGLYS